MPETPRLAAGSILLLVACASPPASGPPPKAAPRADSGPAVAAAAPTPAPGEPAMTPSPDRAPAETCLGVADKGIWSDLDEKLTLSLPASITRDRIEAVVSADGDTLVLYVDGWPRKPYPLDADGALRPGDAAELAGLVDDRNRRRLDGPAKDDRDGDDVPDALDILMGAKKTAIEAGAYGGQYIRIEYPGGDVPRTMGVCTDVVIRALRNAGLDLQVEVHKDIQRARKAYPMVKGKGDTNIDHRRVRTILPWFRRHAEEHTIALDDATDPLRPGDIVFLDTLTKAGPDHIGIISDTLGDSGLPLVINSWTDGYVTQEMDLLGWVPVTHRFRL
jgi:uncharacterized protein YijF (DUF1287 family)